MSESYSVKAILSATDQGFKSAFGAASSAVDSLEQKIKGGLAFGILTGIGQRCFDVLSSGISEMTGGLADNAKAWKTFDGNMKYLGKTDAEINKVKKSLQSFATETIYSASDMASTYAQLEAVGTKNTEQLVKGFGGLAAAAENPQQAMKTLSQQATQMAAKPKVAWQDFKLMLEQTPAGIAAVADQLGMTTSDLISKVQDGEVKTEDFFNAIVEAGAGADSVFAKMATQYQTVDQAMDGMKETIANKLAPAYDILTEAGIGAITKISDAIDGIDDSRITGIATKIVDGFRSASSWIGSKLPTAIETLKPYWETLKTAVSEVVDAFTSAFGAIAGVTDRTELASNASGTFSTAVEKVKGVLLNVVGALEKYKEPIAYLIEHLPQIVAGFEAMKVIGPLANVGGRAFSFLSSSMSGISKVSGNVSKGLRSAGTGIGGLFEKVKGFKFDSLVNESSKLPGFLKKGLSGAKGVIDDIGNNTVRSWGGTIKEMVGETPKGLQTVVSGIGKGLGSAGTAITGGLGKIMSLGLKALLPASLIGLALAGLGLLQSQFGEQINGLLQLAQEKGPEIITNLGNGITSALPGLISQGAELLVNFIDTITANIPSILSTGTEIVTTLVSGVAAAAPSLIGSAFEMVGQLLTGIAQQLPSLIVSGMELLLSLAQGIADNLPQLVNSATDAIVTFISGISEHLPEILTTAVDIIVTLASGLISAIPELIGAIPEIVGAIIDGILNTDWVAVGKSILDSILGGLGKIADWFTGGSEGGSEVAKGASTGITSSAGEVTGAATTVATETVSAFTSVASETTSAGTEMGTNFSEGLSSGLSTAGSTVDSSLNDITKNFSKSVTTSQTAGTDLGNGVYKGVEPGLNKTVKAADLSMQKFNQAIKSGGLKAVSTARGISNSTASAMQAGVSGAYYSGTMVGQGFANGINAMRGSVSAAAASLASAANRSITVTARIGSPSKVERKDGQWFGKGFGLGIGDMFGYVADMGCRLVAAGQARIPSFNGQMSDEYSYGAGGEIRIVVPVEVDGKTIAKAEAAYTEAELKTLQIRKNRALGLT